MANDGAVDSSLVRKRCFNNLIRNAKFTTKDYNAKLCMERRVVPRVHSIG